VTAREKLKEIDAEIKTLSEQQATLSEKEYNLSVSRNEILQALLVEENPFEGTEWQLEVSSNGSRHQVYLDLIAGDDKKMEEIRDLCFRSWHDSFEMASGVTLDFNDGRFSLRFDDPRQLSIFAQKQRLIITAPNVSDNIRKLRRQLQSLEEIAHQFNLKV